MTLAEDQAARLRELVVAHRAPVTDASPAPSPRSWEGITRGVTTASLTPAPPAPATGARVISVSSGKGGVGKSNIAVNLAITLAQGGRRVALLDADLGVANADVLCGINPVRRVERVLAQRTAGTAPVRLADVGVDAPGGFTLIPGTAGIARLADLNAPERRALIDLLVELEQTYDCVIVDTGAGVGALVRSMIAAADLALIVLTPEPTSVADAYALIKCLHASSPVPAHASAPSVPALALVVNQAQGPSEAELVHQRVRGVCQRFLGADVPLAGWVAQDAHLARAVRSRRPVLLESPSCPASRGITALGESVAKLALIPGGRTLRPSAGTAWWTRLTGR